MFCKHCGAEAAEGDLHCRSCGMPMEEIKKTEEIVEPVGEEYVEQTPVEPTAEETVCSEPAQTNEPVITFNTAESEKPKKKGKTVLIVILAVVLAAAVLVALNFTAIKVWFTRTFTAPEEIITSAYKDGTTDVISSFSGYYDTWSEFTETSKTVDSEIRLTLGDNLLGMAEQALTQALNLEDGSLSWLSDMRLKVTSTQDGSCSENRVAFNLGDNTIISLDSIYDSSANMQWIGIPELNEQMLYTAAPYDLFSPPAYIAPAAVTQLPTSLSFEAFERLCQDLVDVMLENMGDVEAQTKTCTIGEITQDVYVLETRFTEQALMQISIQFMESVKQNPEIKAFFDEYTAQQKQMMEELYASMGMAAENIEVDLYADFVASMDAEIAALQSQMSQASNENYLVLYTYLDDENKLTGIEFLAYDADADVDGIRILHLSDGDAFAQEFVVDDISITGTGTSNETYNAVFSFVDYEEVLRIEIVDAVMNEERLTGTFRIIPGAGLKEGIGQNLDAATTAMLNFADIALEIKLDYGKDNASAKVSVLIGTMELVGVEVKSVIKAAEPITIPETGVDANDEQQVTAWFESFAVQQIMVNLQEAGFPADLLTMITESIMSDVA